MTNPLRVILPIGLFGFGVVCTGALILASSGAEKSEAIPERTPVEISRVHATTVPILVQATGTVTPARQVHVSAEVSGRVVYQSPNLIPGGRFEQGETLLRIDSRDYALGVDQEQSRVRQAELELELERGRQATASREWEVIGDGRPADEARLALREPQLQVAEQAVASAHSGLKRAQLALSRTRVTAPFNAVVAAENIDVGQVVAPGATLATLVDADEAWITASVPVERLRWIDVPGLDGATRGATAKVTQAMPGAQPIERTGEVLRVSGQLDPATRTAQLLVVVDNPLDDGGLPLLTGAFVTIDLEGRDLTAFSLPSVAVYEGSRVWTLDDNDRLLPVEVAVAYDDGETAAIVEGLEEGARVVVSPMARPLAGGIVEILPSPSAVR